MMVSVGAINKDKGDIYGKGISKKLLPKAEALDQMAHDNLMGIRQNAFPIYQGYAEAMASRNTTYQPNAFIAHKTGYPLSERLDNRADVNGLSLEILEQERAIDAMGSRAFALETVPENQTATAIVVLENSTIGTISDNVRMVSKGFIIPWLRDFIRVLQSENKVETYLGGDEEKRTRGCSSLTSPATTDSASPSKLTRNSPPNLRQSTNCRP